MFADLPDDHRLWLNAMEFKTKMLEGHIRRAGDGVLVSWFTSRAFSLARWQRRNKKGSTAELDRLVDRLSKNYPGSLHPDSWYKPHPQKQQIGSFTASILIQSIKVEEELYSIKFPLNSENREGLINLLADLEETCKLAIKELSTYAAN